MCKPFLHFSFLDLYTFLVHFFFLGFVKLFTSRKLHFTELHVFGDLAHLLTFCTVIKYIYIFKAIRSELASLLAPAAQGHSKCKLGSDGGGGKNRKDSLTVIFKSCSVKKKPEVVVVVGCLLVEVVSRR